MKKIYINSELLNYSESKLFGLAGALIQFHSKGFEIFTDNLDNADSQLFNVLQNYERIDIKTRDKKLKYDFLFSIDKSEEKESIIINSQTHVKTIAEAVKVITKNNRTALINRKTKETEIKIDLNLDGSGQCEIFTGVGFFDHMLEQIARHGNMDLKVDVKGDLHVDEHHTVEDVGIALGEAVASALSGKTGIKRFAFILPMDDSIAKCAVDLGGRTFLNFKCKFRREKVGGFPTELTKEFFKGMAMGLKANIYLRAKGENDHHKIESMFKAFAKTLNEAARIDERNAGGIPSTKGVI